MGLLTVIGALVKVGLIEDLTTMAARPRQPISVSHKAVTLHDMGRLMDVEGFGEPTGYEQPAEEIAEKLRRENVEYDALFLHGDADDSSS
jgi:hypothetical protein